MNLLIALANEFEEKTLYIKSVLPSLKLLQGAFPNVKLRKFEDFEAFLNRYIHALIRKYLVRTKSVRNCSGISPDFAEFAAKHGFAVLVEKIPNHVRNVFLGEKSGYIVDLSYIQFSCKNDDEDLIKTLKDIYKNPFKAIKIEKLPPNYFGNFSVPHGEYDELYDPSKYIELYDKDLEGQEEDFQAIEKWDNALKKKKNKSNHF